MATKLEAAEANVKRSIAKLNPEQKSEVFATLGIATVETLKTRIEEGAVQSETKLSINWDDAKAERAFATRGVRIAAQAMMRASGTIPAELSVTVSELAKRERGGFAMKPTAANAQRVMLKLSDAEYAATLIGIGVAAAEVKRMVANRAKVETPVGVEAKRAARAPSAVVVTKPSAPKAARK